MCIRYILDGDRDELRDIRSELSSLRAVQQQHYQHPPPLPSHNSDHFQHSKPQTTFTNMYESGVKYSDTRTVTGENREGKNIESFQNVYERQKQGKQGGGDSLKKSNNSDSLHQLIMERKELLSTGLYNTDDALITELDQSILLLRARLAEEGE